MLIDTHIHLNFDEYEGRLDELVKDAKENDVCNMIIIGIDPKSNLRALKIAERYDFYAAVGIHPGNVDNFEAETLIPLINHKKVVAIGETGIDLYRRQDNLLRQQFIFRRQIQLAIDYNLPLVIHMRDSFEEIYEILKEYKNKVTGVFHSFTLGKDEAKKIVDLGFYIGINGIITFKSAKELQEAVKDIPIDRLLLETDAPFLTPDPFRGRRNEPQYIKFVAIKLASLLDISYEKLANITSENAKRLFKIGKEYEK